MKFFIPGIDTDETEKVYAAIKEFNTKQLNSDINEDRIYSVEYYDDESKERVKATVGESGVMVILRMGGTYLICTANRGVYRDLPIMVGALRGIVEFEK